MRTSYILGLALLASACGAGHAPLDGAKTEYVHGFGSSTLMPTFLGVQSDVVTLAAAVEVLETTLDAVTLEDARDAWRRAHVSWSRSEVLLFDRLDDLFFIFRVDEPNINPTTIENAIAGAAVLDTAFIGSSGTPAKGMHALEYLLFAQGPGDVSSLDALTASVRRGEYLSAVADDLVLRLMELNTVAMTLSATASVATDAKARSTVDKIVNRLLNRAEEIADQSLGKALGMTAGGVPQVGGEESPFADHTLQDLRAEVNGIRLIWRGSSGDAGLAKLLSIREPQSVESIESNLRALEYRLRDLPGPFSAALISNRALVEDAFERAKALSQVLRVTLPRGLAVTGFSSPFDGD